MRHGPESNLLKLARFLADSHAGLTLDEMAQALEVSRRTAERMRVAIAAAFGEMEEVRDGRTIRFRYGRALNNVFQTPTSAELVELDSGIEALRTSGDTARAATLETLRAKVRAAMQPKALMKLDADVDAMSAAHAFIMQVGPRPVPDSAILSPLREALLAMRLCSFDYLDSKSGAVRRKRVTPFGILYGRSHYLVAAQQGYAEPYLYRFDRMSNVCVEDQSAPPPPDFDLRAFAAKSFGTYQEKPADVVLRFLPSAAADARRFRFHVYEAMEDQPDGSLIVRFSAGGLLEMAHHLFSWGDAVQILAPKRLRTLMRDELDRAGVHHKRYVAITGTSDASPEDSAGNQP